MTFPAVHLNCRHLVAFTLTLILLLTSPLLLLLFPLYLFRFLVAQLSRHFRPDHGKMLTSMANLFGSDFPRMYTTRTACTVCASNVIDGQVDLEQLRRLTFSTLVKLKDGSTQYPHPEMLQTITQWMGYLFWKWDRNFAIENHVKMYEGPGKFESPSGYDVEESVMELTNRPFKEGTSPWEIWVWNNVKFAEYPGKSMGIIMFRCHHCLADGYSIIKYLLEDGLGQDIKDLMPKLTLRARRVQGCLQTFWKGLKFLVRAPFQTMSVLVQAYDFNDWHIPQHKLKGRLVGARTEIVSVQEIKDIKKIYGCSFHAVLHAAVAGGIRNFMIERNLKIPRRFHSVIPLPIQGHPNKMRNHMTLIYAPLPLTLAEPRDRIRFVENNFNELRNSAAPSTLFAILPFVGCLPLGLIQKIPLHSTATCIMTHFPGPSEPMKVLGHLIVDMSFCGTLQPGNMGMGASSFSYNGGLRFVAGADEAIIGSREMAQDLVDKMRQELRALAATEMV